MNKKNLILLAGLIVLLVIFWFARKRDHIETEFNFFKFDSLTVDVINLTTATDTLELSKLDGEWWITQPLKAEIEQRMISKFFADVIKVKVPNHPMSENPDSFNNYNVADNQGYNVSLKNKAGRAVADFKVGEGSNYSYSYIRRTNGNKVYQVKKNIFQTCKPTLRSWRSGLILDIKQDEVDKIIIDRQDTSFEMIRKEGETEANWTYKDATEEFVIDRKNTAMRKFSNFVSGLRSGVYYDGQWDELKQYFELPLATVTIIKKDGSQEKLYISKNEADDKFIIKKNNYTDTIYQTTPDLFGRISFSKEQFKEKKSS